MFPPMRLRAARRELRGIPLPDMVLKRSLRGRRSRILVIARDSPFRIHFLLSLGWAPCAVLEGKIRRFPYLSLRSSGQSQPPREVLVTRLNAMQTQNLPKRLDSGHGLVTSLWAMSQVNTDSVHF